MFQRILVAIDHSDARNAAVDMTARLASLTGASVRALHIDPYDVVLDTAVGLEDDRTAHEILDDAVNAVRQAFSPCACRGRRPRGR
ncbi:MAG: universal stress protein [Actinoallomurus sp.]